MNKFVTLIAILLIGYVGFATWHARSKSDFDKRNYLTATHQFSTTDARSFWVIVNKQRPLKPKTYVPADLIVPNVPLRENITVEESKLVYVASGQLQNMFGAAKQQGIELELESGYRSYEFQQKLHDNFIQQQGDAEASASSALPGYSEHQTGLAADLGSASNPSCNVKPCFGNTPEARWLAANAYKYGFIVRYPKNKQKITGYEYEPWHLRYTGIYLANQMKSKHIATLEEYFKAR